MKKLLLMFAAVAALAFVACDGNANKADENQDSVATDSTVVTEETITAEDFDAQLAELASAGDQAKIDELVAKSEATIKQLQAAGDESKLKEFVEKVKAAIEKNKEALNKIKPNLASTLTEKAAAIPALVDAAAAATDGKVQEATESGKAALEEGKAKVEEAKEAGKAKVEETKQQVKEAKDKAVNDAKQKAGDAASKAVGDAAKKIGL